MSLPVWASEHTVTIHRNEGLYQDGTGVYYCVKDGIMMTFTDGLDNENYLVERHDKYFEVNSYNYLIKKIVFHCVDNTTASDLDCFYWGPTTISIVQNFYDRNNPGTYQANGYTGTWTGTSNHMQFTTMGKPVRFGSVDIVYDKLEYCDWKENDTDETVKWDLADVTQDIINDIEGYVPTKLQEP